MRISHKFKFVLLSNPRCGSTSVRTALTPYSEIKSKSVYPYHHHTGARALKAHFEKKGWNWEDYTTITTLRNPWDRAVSIWHYGLKNPKSVWNKHCSVSSNFHEFVVGLPGFMKNVVYAGGHLKAGQKGMSLSEFAYSSDGEKLIDHILPIETNL